MWFGAQPINATMDSYKLQYSFQWTGIFVWTYAGGPQVMEFVTAVHPASFLNNGYAIGFPNGIYMGTAESAPRHLPSAAAPPGTITGYRQGDVIFNSAPASGQPMGWMCGSAAWLPMPNLA
jgi:hypothetical protein